MAKKRRRVRRSLVWTAGILSLVLIILAGFFTFKYIEKKNWQKEQVQRRAEVYSWLESRHNFESQIQAVSKPEDMEQESFDQLKTLALGSTDYSWVSAINDETEITDEMMEQLHNLPKNESGWSRLMTSLGTIPTTYVQMALTDDDRLDFALKYPEQAQMQTAPETLEESLETVPLLIQWDNRWGYIPYGDLNVAIAGCGPTTMAMVLSYLNQDPAITPPALAKMADENGLYVIGAGSSLEIFPFLANTYGVECVGFETTAQNIVDLAAQGYPIILQMVPGDFTRTGHFIVITGVENGQLKVNDPNSKKRSAQLWDPETVASQAASGWYFLKSE